MVTPKFTIGISEDARIIRTEVFIKEQGFVNEFDSYDSSLWTLVLYLDGTPISTARLKPLDPETYQIERVAVRKQYRGMKVGTYTMKFMMNKIISLGGRWAIVHAQQDKMDFYKKLGFKLNTEVKPFDDEGVPHVEMSKYLLKRKGNQRK